MGHKKYNRGDVVTIDTATMRSPRIGVILSEDENAMYNVRIHLGKPIKCPTCGARTTGMHEMDMHRLHKHYVGSTKDDSFATLWENGKIEAMIDDLDVEKNDFGTHAETTDVSVNQSEIDLVDLNLEESMVVLVTVSLPNTMIAERMAESVRRAVEMSTHEGIRVERDVATAMSVRKLIWMTSQEEKMKNKAGGGGGKRDGSEEGKNGVGGLDNIPWAQKLPRHLDQEPLLTVVRTYSANDHGKFTGHRILVLTRDRLFVCHENLEQWKLPSYWRTKARSGTMERERVERQSMHDERVRIERDRNARSIDADEMEEEEKYEERRQKCKERVVAYQRRHEKRVKQKRQEFNAAAVRTLELSTSLDMRDVVEYAPSKDIETPVMYMGFEEIVEGVPSISLYEHVEVKYETPSIGKYRYLFEFDMYETAIEWERALRPWMSGLEAGVHTD